MYSNIGFITQGRPLLYPNITQVRYENYEVLEEPLIEPLTLQEVKNFLKIPNVVTADDALLNSLIVATRIFFESYTNRILINTTFRTFANCFAQSFEYSRGKLQSLQSFQYLQQDGSFINIDPTTYQILNEKFYWRIIFPQFQDLPTDKEDKVNIFQGIRTDFVAGFGDSQNDIPEDIKIGLLNQISFLYENRGDCDTASCSDCSMPLPAVSRMIYNKYRHQTAFGSKFRGI